MAACRISFAVTPGLETSTACEAPFTVTTLRGWIRAAMARRTSVPIAWSAVGISDHDGIEAQAGGPEGSLRAASEAGRCDNAIARASLRGTSAAKIPRNSAGLT